MTLQQIQRKTFNINSYIDYRFSFRDPMTQLPLKAARKTLQVQVHNIRSPTSYHIIIN